jgi:hypothetical protein
MKKILLGFILAIGMVSCTSEDLPTQGQDATTPPIVNPPKNEKPIYKNMDSFVFNFSEIVTYKNGKEYSVQKTPITVKYDTNHETVIYSRQGSLGVNDIITYSYHVLKEVDGSLFVEDDSFTVDHFMRLKISSSKIEVFEMYNESTQVSEFKDWELR